MKFAGALAIVVIQGIVVASALPQGGYSSSASSSSGSCCGGNANASPSQNYEPQGSAATFGSESFASNQQQGFGGGGSGGNLNVECKRQEVSPGRFKFVCEGVNPSAISLRSEHILWLTGPEGQKQVVDIEVPNYKIEELIKAGFKTTPGEGTLINVLLKRPEQSYDAQVDTLKTTAVQPSVNLQYEPVQKTLVHYPNDKAYSPLSGPLVPPAGGSGSGSNFGAFGGGGGGRAQRQVQAQFSQQYSQTSRQ